MTSLSRTTTRNSTLTKTSTRGSGTRASQRSESRRSKPGLFSKIKSAFSSHGSNGGGGGGDTASTAISSDGSDDEAPNLLTVPTSSRRRRRSSVFARKSTREATDSERELEERKSRCMAIKVAKRDPLPIQRLLVDCEFCNPPAKFGRDVDIVTSGYTAESVQCVAPPPALVNNELAWNTGLAEWTRIRHWWLSPTAQAVPVHHLDADLTPDKFYTVYDKMVYQTRPLKHPLNLDDMLQIVKAGWVGEGTWPAQDDPNDVWSTSDAEDIKGNIAAQHGVEDGAPRHAGLASSPVASTATSAANSATHTPTSSLHSPGVPALRVSTPGASAGHVQFSELPHPKDADLQPVSSGSRERLPPLERLQSGMGSALKPVRSAQSSLVSLTDSE